MANNDDVFFIFYCDDNFLFWFLSKWDRQRNEDGNLLGVFYF